MIDALIFAYYAAEEPGEWALEIIDAWPDVLAKDPIVCAFHFADEELGDLVLVNTELVL